MIASLKIILSINLVSFWARIESLVFIKNSLKNPMQARSYLIVLLIENKKDEKKMTLEENKEILKDDVRIYNL